MGWELMDWLLSWPAGLGVLLLLFLACGLGLEALAARAPICGKFPSLILQDKLMTEPLAAPLDLDPVAVDAQAMHQAHPLTFEAPDDAELKVLMPTDAVKICVAEERFWVVIEAVDAGRVVGRIDNDLVRTAVHGLKYHQRVSFSLSRIYSVYRESDQRSH